MSVLIPAAALHQNIAVLGKNGSGKTYAAKGALIEPLLVQRRRVAIVDPTGAWWGLRTSRDGKGPGFKILVLGGDHGDLPLPAKGGAAVARLLVEQGVNLIADTSQLTVGERTRWFTDFAGTLYRINKTPLHLVLDEAHNFAPQGKVPDPDAGKMLHAASALASQGRSRGIRLTMITQRPQKLHKDSLTSADTLIALRVLHPLDRGAVADWINGCADPAKGKEVLNSLANLQRGEGWAWYPEGGFLQRMIHRGRRRIEGCDGRKLRLGLAHGIGQGCGDLGQVDLGGTLRVRHGRTITIRSCCARGSPSSRASSKRSERPALRQARSPRLGSKAASKAIGQP